MTEEIKTTETQKQESPKVGRPAKGVTVKNTSKRPITLIAGKNSRETILPTESKDLPKDFMAEIEKNRGAMQYFKDGELVKV